jgi:hypothetical protein
MQPSSFRTSPLAPFSRMSETGDDAPTQLVDAATVARRLNVSRAWVYDNAGRLGAIRLGDGPRARLRFDLMTVCSALATTRPQPLGAERRRSHPRKPASSVPLLPIRGDRP